MDGRSDEEKIIESLMLEGLRKQYEDLDFLPIRQSLYNVETVIPEYDDEVGLLIQWSRPQAFSETPTYLNSDVIAATQGNLPDENFIGALIATALYPRRDLLQTLIASRPDDFRRHGIYTCRFYVEGSWEEVITDTTIPGLRNDATGLFVPVYSRSPDPNELWIPFLEKAYAKAVGNYEQVSKIKIPEAFMHLTGGSVQQISMHDDSLAFDGSALWKYLMNAFKSETIVTAMPTGNFVPNTSTEEGEGGGSVAGHSQENAHHYDHFVQNRLYTVVLCRETSDFELVLMHNPWVDYPECWSGEWGNRSADWDLYPELLQEMERDPEVPWRRANPKGYFWISFKNFKKFFNTVYFCKLFPSDDFKFYCMKSEWKGKLSGGPLQSIRDKSLVMQEANESHSKAMQKATIPVTIDGDSSWFNNPQVRVSTSTPTEIFISMVPLSTDGGGHIGGLSVVKSPRTIGGYPSPHLWDGSTADVLAVDKVDPVTGRIKGQEVSIWSLKIDSKHYYHIVPNTNKRGQDGPFVLRVFSKNAITVENVPSLHCYTFSKSWHRANDIDSAGGPLKISQDNKMVENPKWCQNPQFHVEVVDPFGRDEVYIKFVLRRTDKGALISSKNASFAGGPGEAKETTVGMVVVKADVLDDSAAQSLKKKQPRQNAMGELIPLKESSLKKKKNRVFEDPDEDSVKPKENLEKTILRKTSLVDEVHVFETSYTSRQEACLLLSNVTRSWMPNGLIVVPSLSEKTMKGTFDLEIYSSEELRVKQMPESFSRSIASEWSESSAGGSHIFPQWKKNPKFSLKFRPPTRQGNLVMEPIPVSIRLGRHGINWKSMIRRDTVGCLVGFYVFLLKNGELLQLYESPFVPSEEVCSESSFALPPIQNNDEYIIMPCTFNEGKKGSFILTVTMETEFSFSKEKT